MPGSTFWGMQHLNNNVMCSVRTTRTNHDRVFGEIFEVTILPCDQFFNPHKHLPMFNLRLRPERMNDFDQKAALCSREEASKVHLKGITKEDGARLFEHWFKKMGLPYEKKLILIGHELHTDRANLMDWLGEERYREVFSDSGRDLNSIANFMNDNADCRAEKVPYAKQGLSWLANVHSIPKFANTCTENARQILSTYRAMVLQVITPAFGMLPQMEPIIPEESPQ